MVVCLSIIVAMLGQAINPDQGLVMSRNLQFLFLLDWDDTA